MHPEAKLRQARSRQTDLVFKRRSTRLFSCTTTYIVDHFHCANGRVKHTLLIRYLGF